MLFVGRDTSDVSKSIKKDIVLMSGILVLFIIISVIVGFILVLRSNKAISDIVDSLKKLENGELKFRINDDTFDRTDELGVIASSSAELRDKLQDVIKTTMGLSNEVAKSGENLSASAQTASQVAEQVAGAVEEISKGALSQAQSVQDSLNDTDKMGKSIDEISGKVDDLSAAATNMMTGANHTVDTLNTLLNHNEGVKSSMKEINGNIHSTNDAVREIAAASNVITSISEQTNLLSLNASIEAARAGDAGRGFSVVANEIRNLAEQSKSAAESINGIIENLVSKSEMSVTTIEKLDEELIAQNRQLNNTKNDMDAVVGNVSTVDESTRVIADKVRLLEELKDNFAQIVENLSSISQENAASTEETTASMEELSATSAVISEAAVDLKKLADQLHEKMNYFLI